MPWHLGTTTTNAQSSCSKTGCLSEVWLLQLCQMTGSNLLLSLLQGRSPSVWAKCFYNMVEDIIFCASQRWKWRNVFFLSMPGAEKRLDGWAQMPVYYSVLHILTHAIKRSGGWHVSAQVFAHTRPTVTAFWSVHDRVRWLVSCAHTQLIHWPDCNGRQQ